MSPHSVQKAHFSSWPTKSTTNSVLRK
jgi:hypothetical protein